MSQIAFDAKRAAGQPGNAALAALAHPVALACAGALLFNALVWQRLWPSWWTGKLGDVAALVLVPLLAALPLSAVGRGRRVSRRAFAVGVCLPVAVAFAAAKAVPAVNSALLAGAASLGLALKLRLDPSDLLALPAVLAAVWLWGKLWHWPALAPRRLARAAGLGLAALAVLADTAAPIDHGMVCLTTDGASELAVRMMLYNSENPFSDGVIKDLYRSSDGGLTWQPDTTTDAKKLACETGGSWPIDDPSGAGRLFYVSGQGIYASTDQGLTLKLERPLPDVEDYEVDAANHTLIVAAGTNGIWVKIAAGVWKQTLVLK